MILAVVAIARRCAEDSICRAVLVGFLVGMATEVGVRIVDVIDEKLRPPAEEKEP